MTLTFNPRPDTNMAKLVICVKDYQEYVIGILHLIDYNDNCKLFIRLHSGLLHHPFFISYLSCVRHDCGPCAIGCAPPILPIFLHLWVIDQWAYPSTLLVRPGVTSFCILIMDRKYLNRCTLFIWIWWRPVSVELNKDDPISAVTLAYSFYHLVFCWLEWISHRRIICMICKCGKDVFYWNTCI